MITGRIRARRPPPGDIIRVKTIRIPFPGQMIHCGVTLWHPQCSATAAKMIHTLDNHVGALPFRALANRNDRW